MAVEERGRKKRESEAKKAFVGRVVGDAARVFVVAAVNSGVVRLSIFVPRDVEGTLAMQRKQTRYTNLKPENSL